MESEWEGGKRGKGSEQKRSYPQRGKTSVTITTTANFYYYCYDTAPDTVLVLVLLCFCYQHYYYCRYYYHYYQYDIVTISTTANAATVASNTISLGAFNPYQAISLPVLLLLLAPLSLLRELTLLLLQSYPIVSPSPQRQSEGNRFL